LQLLRDGGGTARPQDFGATTDRGDEGDTHSARPYQIIAVLLKVWEVQVFWEGVIKIHS
jgi:hypothetical protein